MTILVHTRQEVALAYLVKSAEGVKVAANRVCVKRDKDDIKKRRKDDLKMEVLDIVFKYFLHV